jgi:ferritin
MIEISDKHKFVFAPFILLWQSALNVVRALQLRSGDYSFFNFLTQYLWEQRVKLRCSHNFIKRNLPVAGALMQPVQAVPTRLTTWKLK